jgi:hypothetical protein
MRKRVRGLRGIERSVLGHRRDAAPPGSVVAPEPGSVVAPEPGSVVAAPLGDDPAPARDDPAGDVVLAYCAVVRGILNDDQGGPLHPPGLRMAEALEEVRGSIGRNLAAKKGGSRRGN